MIVLLLGHKAVGKDEFAKVLTKKCEFVRVAIADLLKAEILIGLQPIDQSMEFDLVNMLTDPERKEDIVPYLGISARQLMQNWGAFRRLNNGENYWVSSTIMKCNHLLQQDPDLRIVITDVRYANELEALRFWFTQQRPNELHTVRITRPGKEGDSHQSEELARRDDLDIDFEIENNGTLTAFRRKALEFGNYVTRANQEATDR